jgi:phosphoenolpyruvate carboxylase
MERVAAAAHASFRRVVYEDPRFLSYYRAVTPQAELDSLHIGSRPARRGGGDGLASLRAIPWQFAWNADAAAAGILAWRRGAVWRRPERGGPRGAAGDVPALAVLRSLVDLLQMTLAKADPRIAAEYDRRLAPPDLQSRSRSRYGLSSRRRRAPCWPSPGRTRC